ncbi:MAG: sulfatase [Deltaproteobacteria bacterium]|nr:sulfatase [Deltaproteobacteria bacterium]
MQKAVTSMLTPALAVVVLAAKALTVALRFGDGAAGGLGTPLAPLALIHQDLWLILIFGAGETALATLAHSRPALNSLHRVLIRVAYALVVVCVAINVPVARLFSTPATFAFLHAMGNAVGDSARVFLTPINVGAPLAIGALALVYRPIRLPPGRIPVGAFAVGMVAALAGGAAVAHVPTMGLHRNAVITLVRTSAAHYMAPPPANDPSPLSPACAPAEGDAADLLDLRGAARNRNVVLIILESTAARFLTAYGARREVTPNLTALARDAVLFQHAYAAYPESIKGLFSMLCARAPIAGGQAAAWGAGSTACDALPAGLADAGYKTALLHAGRFAYLGMNAVVRDRGFHVLEDGASIGGAFSSSFGVDEPATVRRLLAFVDGLQPSEKFFAVYMPIAGHHPYHAPGDGARPFAEDTPADAYANDLFVGDAAIGLLRDGLVRRGLDARTLYVVVGDHGEAFFEHEGNFIHSLFLYEENVRVPFLIAAPGLMRGTRRAPQLASALDVAPTILDLLGLPPRAGHQGRSLLPPVPRLVTFFTDQGVPQAAVREGRWKMIDDRESGRAQLFDLDADPDERTNLAVAHPDRIRRYRACLAGL